MIRRPIHDDVMDLASRLVDKCHPQVAQSMQKSWLGMRG